MKIKISIIILAFIALAFIINNSHKQSNIHLKADSSDGNGNTSSEMQPPQPKNANLYKFPETGIPVLMFHSISTKPGNTLCVSENQFKEEMAWLKSQNYHTITLDELYQALTNNALLPEKPILLTFDDGYADNFKQAWPILQQYGFWATFFIAVNYNKMDWNELKELVRQGNSIGSHTVTHLDLTTRSAKQQEIELTKSKQILKDQLSINIIAFCYPSGRYNKTTLGLVEKSGYKLGFTTNSGKVHFGDDLYTLKRIRVSSGISLAAFQNLIR